MKEALKELAAILNPAFEANSATDPLLIAMGAVGKVLDIPIIPPKSNKSQVNSVETIAQNSDGLPSLLNRWRIL